MKVSDSGLAAVLLMILAGCASAPQEKPCAGFSPEYISGQRALERRYSGKIVFLMDPAMPEAAKLAERIAASAKEQKLRIEFREVERKRIPGMIRTGYADGGIGSFMKEDAADLYLAMPRRGVLIRADDKEIGKLFQDKTEEIQLKQ